MNAREKFIEVMRFNNQVKSLKWEYAYWGATLNRWYQEGLPKEKFISLPENITTPTSSLYLAALRRNTNKINRGVIPKGQAVFGGGVYWPTQGVPKEKDVEIFFNLDKGITLVDVNQLFCPMYEIEILDENRKIFKYIDIDGITRIYQKEEATMPTAIEWKIKDWKSWSKVKSEKLNNNDISCRFPKNWDIIVEEYRTRDYPITLGGYPHGLFGTLSHIMGYENLFLAYYDSPDLIHDILNTFTELWINIWEEVIGQVEVDMVQFFEDVSMGTGSMISSAMFKEFMLPYYKRITQFLNKKGIHIIFVDTDGDCEMLIPLFLEGGVTGLYPMETSTGMDILTIRKKFPELQMMGGVSKYLLTEGKGSIDSALCITAEMLKAGGYIPYVDHSIPPTVSWESFKYYRRKLNDLINATG